VTEYRLTSAKHHHVLVVVCLNRVSLDGYASPDEAIAKLIDLGYQPELRYQLNPIRGEFDLYAAIHDLPLSESRMNETACKALWENFNHSSIYTIGTQAAYNPNWLAIRDFEDPRRLAQPEDIEAIPLQAAAS
jgi:hypothetical protein